MRRWSLCLLILAAETVATSARADLPNLNGLTLGHALKMALQSSPIIESARVRARVADPMTGQAIADALPTLQLTGSAQSRRDPLNIGNPNFGGTAYNTYDFGLRLSQPLYRGGMLPAELKQASREQRIRELDLLIAERELGLVLIEAYESILLEQQRESLHEEDRELQRELLATARQRQSIGRAQLLDTLQIESQLAAIEPRIARARNTMEGWAATLAQALGEPEVKTFALQGRLEPFDVAPLLTLPVNPVAELERAGLLREQQDARAEIRLSPYQPRLDAFATYQRNAFVREDLLDPYATSWSAGVQLSWPIFQGLNSVFDKRELREEARRLEIDETRVREERAVAQIRARQALEIARTVVEASHETAELQKKTLAEARRLYRLSTLDTQQFLIIQQAELNARIALMESVTQLAVQAARYCAASGIPLPSLLEILEVKK